MYGFFFWFSVVSVVLNIALLVWGYGQVVSNRKDKEQKNAQVKIWMQSADGVNQALQRIIQDKWQGLYSSIHDVVNAVHVAHASAFALYQSLYEERAISEEDYKKEQKALRDAIRDSNQVFSQGPSAPAKNPPTKKKQTKP